MASHNLFLLATALLSLVLSFSVPKQCSEAKTHVYISNKVGPGTDITPRCKSKDDDLGAKIVPYNTSYDFSFVSNIWATTLFFCSVSWGTSDFHYFDANDAAIDQC